jgi:hypothetical protein
MPHLRLHSPAFIPGLGSDLQIPGTDVSVGRGPENQLVIPETSVSQRHARIQQTPQGWVLTDLENTNGIWVGVQRVSELQLTPGQLFRIGGVALEFIDDGASPAFINENVDPDGPLIRSQVTEAGSAARHSLLNIPSGPTQVDPPDWELPTDAKPLVEEDISLAPPAMRESYRPIRSGRVFAGLLGLSVLGLAVTFGAVFALRWFTRIRHPVRPKVPAVVVSAPAQRLEVPPRLPDITLADVAVDSIGTEQRVEAPGLLSLLLPANALHRPTHVVLARAPSTGAGFCGATKLVNDPIEIATAYNTHWAEAAVLEFGVDVDQLAKTGVAAAAIGFRDAAEQTWQLLPTEYDVERKVARTRLWQPGFVALFFVTSPDVYAASEHFGLLLEPKPAAQVANSNPAGRSERALEQLEAALSEYGKLGLRIAPGRHWVCATQSNPTRADALHSVFSHRELTRTHSHALARAAFATVVPAYLNSGSTRGREFWFAAMLDAFATRVSGSRVSNGAPSLKRLASPLVADDWPSSPLFVQLISRSSDQSLDLARVWNDTVHVMNELDTKGSNDAQSPVLAVDLALQGITKKTLLELHAGYVNERLSAERGLSLDTLRSHDVCSQVTSLNAEARSGGATLEVPSSFTARWACISVETAPNTVRLLHLRLLAGAPASVSVRLMRVGSGEIIEAGGSATRPLRVDVKSSDVFILSAVNANMSQPASVGLKLDDVTPVVSMSPAEPALVRTGQEVQSTLSLTGAPEELKTVSVRWDFGDGTPTVVGDWTVSANGTLRVAQSHAWPKEGSYTLRATVLDTAQSSLEIRAATRTVTVQAPKVELIADTANLQPGMDVKLHVKTSGPVPELATYRFNFGDGNSPVVGSAPDIVHQFAAPGDYAVVVDLLAPAPSSDVLATAKSVLSIRTAEAPSSEPGSTAQPAVGVPAVAP